jgi:hypothetical protein
MITALPLSEAFRAEDVAAVVVESDLRSYFRRWLSASNDGSSLYASTRRVLFASLIITVKIHLWVRSSARS